MYVYGVIPTYIFIKFAHINKNAFIYIYAYLNIFTNPIIEILINKNKNDVVKVFPLISAFLHSKP